MNLYEALTLNRLLPRLNVGGGAASRTLRVKLIDLRNRLNDLQRQAETYRNDTLSQCAEDPDGQKLAEETLGAYLTREAELKILPFSADEVEQLADANALRMDEYELFRQLVAEKPENTTQEP